MGELIGGSSSKTSDSEGCIVSRDRKDPNARSSSEGALDAEELVVDETADRGHVFPPLDTDPAFDTRAKPQPRPSSQPWGIVDPATAAAQSGEDYLESGGHEQGFHPARLAAVVFGLLPLLGLGFVYLMPVLSGEQAEERPASQAAQFPRPPFTTTTDRPMTARDVDKWLNEKPAPTPGAQLDGLSEPAAKQKPAGGRGDKPPPPGHLYVPKQGETIALDPDRTPTRPIRARRRQRRPRTATGIGLPTLGGLNPLQQKPGFIYEKGKVANSEVFAPPSDDAKSDVPPEGNRAALAVGDAFRVKLHSGLSSVSSDATVLVQVTKAVRRKGVLVIPEGTIIRGTIRTYGERRFFLAFGQFSIGDTPYRLTGRAEERNYAGLLAVRREATLQERQRSTVINGVLSGLVNASALATQNISPAVQQATQVIAQGTRNNTLRENQVQEGYVLEAAKGKRFRILVTK